MARSLNPKDRPASRLLVPPIFVRGDGDLLSFDDDHSMVAYVEWPDVEAGVYRAWIPRGGHCIFMSPTRRCRHASCGPAGVVIALPLTSQTSRAPMSFGTRWSSRWSGSAVNAMTSAGYLYPSCCTAHGLWLILRKCDGLGDQRATGRGTNYTSGSSPLSRSAGPLDAASERVTGTRSCWWRVLPVASGRDRVEARLTFLRVGRRGSVAPLRSIDQSRAALVAAKTF